MKAERARRNRAARRASVEIAAMMLAVSLTLIASAGHSIAATESVIYNFANDHGGFDPIGGLVANNGRLYGTTSAGGGPSPDAGTVFALTAPATSGGTWTLNTLHTFTGDHDGSEPRGSLLAGPNRTFYGVTLSGGMSNAGTVFKMTPPATSPGTWTERVLYAFTGGSDGSGPSAGLVADRATGTLYGTTGSGGAFSKGVVFALTPPTTLGGAWTESVLYAFTGGVDGSGPSGVVIDSNGTLYGTTESGGASSFGTVFTLTPPATPGGVWTETVLYSFNGALFGDGEEPTAGPIIGQNGTLYGTTRAGGVSSDSGTVFSLTPPTSPGGAWTESILYSFLGGAAGDGENPGGALLIRGQTLYGTTGFGGGGSASGGTVFQLTPSISGGVWTETILHSFNGGQDGYGPAAGVIIGPNGALYGTTMSGGAMFGGTVFEVTP